jgi:thiosulfate dehydrogenase (quinone) large subunit
MFTETAMQRGLIFVLRISMGWVFLFAAIRQIPDPTWSAAGFLSGAKTFPGLFEFFASPAILPILNVVVPWVHLLIGLALILGIGVRLAGLAGALLMVLYYLPRLDGFMIGPNNFIVEYHLVYAFVLVYLVAVHAGRVIGLEGWLAERPQARAYLEQHPVVRAAIA